MAAVAARPDPGAREEQGRQGREHRSARLDRPAALQPPAAAVQQREDAPGRAVCCRTRTTTRSASPATRRTASPARRSSPAARRWRTTSGSEALTGKRDFEQGQGADQGSRLQGREDRPDVGHRPADRAFAGAGDAGHPEEARPERRAAGERLGHADHAPRARRSRSRRAAGASSTPGSSAPTSRRRR